MARIRSLRPNVSREEVLGLLSSGALQDLMCSLAFGPLRRVADFYIPFQLFQVQVANAGKRERHWLGLEAVTGSLDLYHFEQLPGPSDVIYIETRNCPTAQLDKAQATDLMLAKFRRVLFSSGLFRLRGLQVSAQALPGEIYIPYWVGFRGRGSHARLIALDAVRRRIEGAKVRRLIESWLLSN